MKAAHVALRSQCIFCINVAITDILISFSKVIDLTYAMILAFRLVADINLGGPFNLNCCSALVILDVLKLTEVNTASGHG